jgi:hypothetical protein
MQETSQVRLRIISPDSNIFNDETGTSVSGKDVLKQLKINNVWKNDKQGKYIGIQFDAFEFVFREGEMITVGATVARALRRNSIICVGSDKLNGPLVPLIEIAEKYELGAPVEPAKEAAVAKSPTSCPICGEEQKTFPALARHMVKERKKNPDLFKEEGATPKTDGKVDWDGEAEDES